MIKNRAAGHRLVTGAQGDADRAVMDPLLARGVGVRAVPRPGTESSMPPVYQVLTGGPPRIFEQWTIGFWIIEALDLAPMLAAEGSKACDVMIEVRPFEGR